MSSKVFVESGTRDSAIERAATVVIENISWPPTTVKGATVTLSTTHNSLGEHRRSVLTKTHSVNGWRNPTHYHCFSTRVLGNPFDFQAHTIPGGRFGYRYTCESTPTTGGLGPISGLEYWGTLLQGHEPDVSTNMINRVTVECMNKLQDQKFNLLADLAETQENVDSACDLLILLARSLLLARKRRWKEALRVFSGSKYGEHTSRALVQVPGNAWLSYNYGIKPVVADITELFKLAASPPKGLGLVWAKRVVTEDGELPSWLTVPSAFASYDEFSSTGYYKYGCEVKLVAEPVDTITQTLAAFGLDNPFALGWELLPYSFVIDWILPIGNVLQALTADLEMVYKCGYRTTRSWCDFTVNTLALPSNRLFDVGTKPSVRYRNVCMTREILLSMPTPFFYVKSPFSTNHVLTAMSLLGQLKSKRGRNIDAGNPGGVASAG